MHIPDHPILWKDPLWSALERGIRAVGARPKFVLRRPDFKDGLNAREVNQLAQNDALSTHSVFEVHHEKAESWHPERWRLVVNHPGSALPVEVWWGKFPMRVAQSDVDLMIDNLRAWQSTRAKQLKVTPDSDDGGSAAQQVAVKPPMTDGQQRLWSALNGCAMTAKELAAEAELDTSEETVRQWVSGLRKAGYKIDNRPGRGYFRPDAPPADSEPPTAT